jgi:myo-inositol catabolism protein IolC
MTPATAPERRWLPNSNEPLFILAMDHRASFVKDVFDINGMPSPEDVARMRTAKSLIYEGLRRVTPEGGGRLGVLVDEDFGSPVTKAARRDGVVLAMPIEKSGVRVFELEYGDSFAKHVAAFDPDFVKVLVRYNPDDPSEVRDKQLSRLHAVSDWAAANERRWLFELLVPPTADQLADGGGPDGYDRDVRPALTATVIAQLKAGGVQPSIWKLEGYDTSAGAEHVLATVAADRDHPASCIVLGRDAPVERVEHWLRIAAAEPGYSGFAVGRTIWEQPLRAHLAQQIEAEELVDQVAHTYSSLIHAYVDARGTPPEERDNR